MNWRLALRFGLDQLTQRYEAFVVESLRDREGAMQVLEEVRRKELRRVTGSSVLETGAFADLPVDDVLLACRDRRDGAIVGTVRGVMPDRIMHLEGVRREYALDQIPEPLLAHSTIATRLAVLPAYRGSAAALVLLRRLYLEGLRREQDLCLLTSEPSLLAMYQRLGLHPFGHVHPSATGGFRVPVVFVLHDEEHLRRVRSPLLRTLTRFDGPRRPAGPRWFRSLPPADIGVEPYTGEDGLHAVLTRGMSPDGVAQLLAGAWQVSCLPGQRIRRGRDGSEGPLVVLAGRVDIVQNGLLVGVHRPGDLVDEPSTVPGSRGTADIHAGEAGARVVQLSWRAVERVRDPADQDVLRRNVSLASGAARPARRRAMQ